MTGRPTRVLVLAAALTVVYLLVLASVHPGDVLTGGAIAVPVAVAALRLLPRRRVDEPFGRRLLAVPALAAGTAADIVRGTWHVILYVVGRRRLERPGLVALPKGERTRSGVAAWGYLTALAPDEIVVDIDEERGVMIVHVLDARDPGALETRHRRLYERRQRRVFP
jgi:multisubunit Na+/H+ antiporter MnhE subunit